MLLFPLEDSPIGACYSENKRSIWKEAVPCPSGKHQELSLEPALTSGTYLCMDQMETELPDGGFLYTEELK